MKKRVQPHIMCGVGDVGKYALISGDPERIKKIASFFNEAKKVADYRGFITYTGELEGTKVSACSTGIGCPSAAIVVEELANIGADTFIRVGTAGSLQTSIDIGDIIIANAAVRDDGTSKSYVPAEFPAVADYTVTQALLKAAQKNNRKIHFGTVLTSDAFYGDMENLKKWSKFHVLSVEMECSIIFTLAMLKKVRAAAILAVDSCPLIGEKKGEFEPGEKKGELNERVQKGIREEIDIATEAISLIEKEKKNKN